LPDLLFQHRLINGIIKQLAILLLDSNAAFTQVAPTLELCAAAQNHNFTNYV